jgi:hypothetical protein
MLSTILSSKDGGRPLQAMRWILCPLPCKVSSSTKLPHVVCSPHSLCCPAPDCLAACPTLPFSCCHPLSNVFHHLLLLCCPLPACFTLSVAPSCCAIHCPLAPHKHMLPQLKYCIHPLLALLSHCYPLQQPLNTTTTIKRPHLPPPANTIFIIHCHFLTPCSLAPSKHFFPTIAT